MYLTILNYSEGVTVIEKTDLEDFEEIEKYLNEKFRGSAIHWMLASSITLNI
jgi:hypothetical protein